ncbi:TIGR04053 family radical SAM/SPASM domain-containing protein [Schinkia azotoformans]|nr:TIGR04053 family radical SAM/SPASM domain-containing protein [Schinkia azotoformans]MEC1695374.1 TIGR04053 family radical SAM/SPASM domain-containing protein [Schinkia azotoformans]MEC1724438.1 TIGR04053 family radical SAM/SPASM domain-containing protein [Schinkia azotoformans]MEC1742690.1 TIGR04053 family radical SAM/SPASM domain-containing protein [Schinkia azotoformans]MEC1767476.1 TIGR04053 family radical SAM/SPASM domain-containing protein [Schinkia azotoformans]MEC1780213.1 TIGR04053 
MIDYNLNPFIVIWEVTRACQLKCVHCRADAQTTPDPNELSHDEGIKLIDQIYEMDNPMLVFTGGDCMMREDLFELADYAVKKGMRVSMVPSATDNVTKEKMEKAKSVGLSRWGFSLDGPTPEIHDHFRGTPGSFKLTLEKIKYLNELEMPLQINTVISRYNYHHLEQMAELVKDLKAVMWYIFLLVPTGRGQLEDCLTPAEHEKVFLWLYELSKTAPYDIKTTAAQHYRRVVIQQKAKEHRIAKGEIHYEDSITTDAASLVDGLKRAPKGVNDGNGFIFVSHTGDVMPSGLLPLVVGNVRETSLKEIYREAPILKELRNPDLYKGKCGVCEFRNVCGGSRSRTYAITGDYLESEPFCVYIPEALRKKAQPSV